MANLIKSERDALEVIQTIVRFAWKYPADVYLPALAIVEAIASEALDGGPPPAG